MKKQSLIVLILTLIFTSILPACHSSEIEKEKYTKLSTSVEMPKVAMLFSLSCMHCKNIESMMPLVERAAQVDIEKVHLVFNPKTYQEAMIYYAAQVQIQDAQVLANFRKQLFFVLQSDFTKLPDGAKYKQFASLFREYQLQLPDKLDVQLTKQVIELVRESKQFVEQANLTAVPAIVVNGQYLVHLNKHKNIHDLAKTIVRLSNRS